MKKNLQNIEYYEEELRNILFLIQKMTDQLNVNGKTRLIDHFRDFVFEFNLIGKSFNDVISERDDGLKFLINKITTK